MACCPCALVCTVPLAVTALTKASSTPAGRAGLLAAAPFVLLAAALATGLLSYDALARSADCVMSCQCARSYALGALAVWMYGIQRLYTSAPPPTKAAMPPVLDSQHVQEAELKGKVAAKAA